MLATGGCTGGGAAQGAASPPASSAPTVSGSSEPTATTVTPTPAATPTATGTAVKPVRPADLDRTDARGAEAAATYFLELYPYVMATGDTAEWDAMTFEKTCEFCTKISDAALAYSAGGKSVTGGDVHLGAVERLSKDSLTGIYPVRVNIRQDDSTLLDSSGSTIQVLEGISSTLIVETVRDDTGWLVAAVSVDA
ncbi:hypothetical protein CLV28_1861 [Sediminihabitans luteus]|uniref:DUF6318 domain-containing protein n=1 Tax=Sediminihabitans luteus TaxID=1138585 RepID=A0A2M9CRA2_9CELL|nr:hypothetical protein CLV28_1861 [Sediminihabitans luteus]